MTDFEKEVHDSEIETGNHILNILNQGINDLRSKLNFRMNSIDLKDCYASIPYYASSFIMTALNSRMLVAGRNEPMPHIELYNGVSIVHGYELNKIIFYHRDFLLHGIEPIVYFIEQPKFITNIDTVAPINPAKFDT